MSRALAALALLCAVTAVWAPAAAADGDPASDVLYQGKVFLPYDVSFPAPLQKQLKLLTAESAASGYPIRVAVIASAYDLGAIPSLWRKPQEYARFLGTELSFVYHGELLVVMPNGFGLYHAGRPVTAGQKALASVTIAPGGTGLARSAVAAVKRLAAAGGHPLSGKPPAAAAPAGGGGSHTLLYALIAAGVLLLLALAWAARRLRLRRPRLPSFPGRGWLIVALVGLAAIVAEVVFAATRSHAAQPKTQSAAPDATWASGASPAPGFTLADPDGGTVSLRPTQGRVTIVTFIDPQCRDYCPLEAQVLESVTKQLPAGKRPRIVAVSVNPPANTAKNVALDKVKWHLAGLPEWHWGFGSAQQLAAVWRAYKVAVTSVPQKAAGVSLTRLVHTEAAYVIDRNGDERALFLWPFSASTLERTISSL
ncbi:MAG TPA: SCO family protein [Gaiellaceae bacterium]|nr:SCO family protein [Gaiellaceae bacterium]